MLNHYRTETPIHSGIGNKNSMSRHMIHFIRETYKEDAENLLRKSLKISDSAIKTGKTTTQEFRELLNFYLKSHENVPAKPKYTTRIYIPKSH